MQEKQQPDPRWKEFIEERDPHGEVIGFKLPNIDHLFVYDQFGGWTDEHGKVYDSQGYLIEELQDNIDDDEDDSDLVDDDIIDDFEQMLIQEEYGIIEKKKKPEIKQEVKHEVKPEVKQEVKVVSEPKAEQNDMDADLRKYIEKLQNEEQIRQGLTSIVWIFYKTKSSHYERITPEVQKIQDLNSRNQLINKKIKPKTEERRKQLLENNKWLQGDFFLDFSGTSQQESAYDRYWYGWVKVEAKDFFANIQQIKKSKEFSLLKSKTLYALKSKFYLKNKMKETINQLKNKLKDVAENNAVLIKINNLPEEFPISLIIDLVQISGGHIEDIEDINIVDNFSADLIAKKRTALAFTNVEGYSHDEHEYTWIEVEPKEREVKQSSMFNVEIDAKYKNPMRQTGDTLALEYSKTELAKVNEQNELYRLVVGESAIKKVLMFRGETLNVVRILRYGKKPQPTQPKIQNPNKQ